MTKGGIMVVVRIVVSLCLAVAGVMLTASSASAYTPREGATFGNPWGTRSQKYAISSHVNQSIDSAPRGSTIQITTFALDLDTSMYKLIRAHNRGVNVKVIVNAMGETRQVRRLKREFGQDITRRSFAITCTRSCRGVGGDMHTKLYMFSQAGAARNVIMASSTNLSHSGATKGWNDLFTIVGRPRLFADVTTVFNEMARDRALANPYRVFSLARYRAFFFPRRGTDRTTDTVYNAMSAVRCFGAAGGAGSGERTVIRVGMFHWAGDRGVLLATKLRQLDNAGCIVKVIYGAPSTRVVSELRRPTRYGGIELYDSRYDLSGDGIPDKYIHSKYMLVSGNFAGDRSSWQVFAGSANWVRAALRVGDDMILRVSGPSVHDRYAHNWETIRRSRTRRVSTLSTLSSTTLTQKLLGTENGQRFEMPERVPSEPLPTFSPVLPEPE
jgi:phosphatidylserine/phosphatidylglycerophosphate/cardiolipin synthase-like enzyme